MADRLPDIAQHFAADARPDRGSSGHHAARGRQDARAEAGEHLRDVVAAEIDAAAGTADALDAGNDPLAVRTVLEKEPQRLDGRRRFGARVVEHLEALNVPFVLKDLRDIVLIRDVGMSTRVCFAVTALRIRVSMSAIGSVISRSQQFRQSTVHR